MGLLHGSQELFPLWGGSGLSFPVCITQGLHLEPFSLEKLRHVGWGCGQCWGTFLAPHDLGTIPNPISPPAESRKLWEINLLVSYLVNGVLPQQLKLWHPLHHQVSSDPYCGFADQQGTLSCHHSLTRRENASLKTTFYSFPPAFLLVHFGRTLSITIRLVTS